jgi:hypothetical protein
MTSLQKQLIIAALGCVVFTLMFGVLLSMAVNQAIDGFERQSDQILPGGDVGELSPQQPF